MKPRKPNPSNFAQLVKMTLSELRLFRNTYVMAKNMFRQERERNMFKLVWKLKTCLINILDILSDVNLLTGNVPCG